MAEKGGDLAVADWFGLPAKTPPLGLDLRAAPGAEDQVTVTGHRKVAPRQGPAPGYEANNSAAAQRKYAPSPVWTSPEQQRLMSNVKDALGLCGALGGLLTCPDP